jgi:hypothetical protein
MISVTIVRMFADMVTELRYEKLQPPLIPFHRHFIMHLVALALFIDS